MTTAHRPSVVDVYRFKDRINFYIVTDQDTTAFSLTEEEATKLAQNINKTVHSVTHRNTSSFALTPTEIAELQPKE